KAILPWFGGTPSVWTTCILFFQVVLLGGYAYAHWLVRHPRIRDQRSIHLALLLVSLAVLTAFAVVWGSPLLPDGRWKPHGDEWPVAQIVLLLGMSVGLPFFVLSATGPLLQAWYGLTHPGSSPYRLYALSNAGSLLGLVSYPFAVEVLAPLATQAALWTGGYLAFAAGIGYTAVGAAGATGTNVRRSADREPVPAGDPPASPGTGTVLLWFALPACASILLLAMTNQLCQEVAVIPFLWMLPLALYLLTFILVFDSDRWYIRKWYLPLMVFFAATITLVWQAGPDVPILIQVAAYAVTLFVCAMVCHGELARLRPPPERLTSFYLAVTAGGAAGGLFVGLAAPNLFAGFWELPIGLWLCAGLVFVVLIRDRAPVLYGSRRWPAIVVLACTVLFGAVATIDRPPVILSAGWYRHPMVWAGWLVAVALYVMVARRRGRRAARSSSGRPRFEIVSLAAALAVFGLILAVTAAEPARGSIWNVRNFYGLLHLVEREAADPGKHNIQLKHGRIAHGLQYQSDSKRREPTSYYGRQSGIGLVLQHHPARNVPQAGMGSLSVGVIGLGAGTLAAYGRAGDAFHFYEINPAVVGLADGPQARFTYLADTSASARTILGDARISLEREAAGAPPARFHVLAVDAFSSDSIPVHLLTREAFQLYLRRLDEESGVLALHVSNRYLDLVPVVWRLAEDLALEGVVVEGPKGDLEWESTWVLLARSRKTLAASAITAAASPKVPSPGPLWTDDYSNLFQVLRVRFRSDGRPNRSPAPPPAEAQT
ncbi:MAG: hypothetical protein A2V83_00965, partial [Nitrospirae bacterium RBG_16_64_22]